ncbi:MAG: hypothetical protein IKX62_00410 [Bacteroidales bacterium]|nr:hypothetical protein [Bacteroidales bacterium]
MKMICRILPPLLAALACCLGAAAQAPDQPEIRSFQQMAGDNAALYSGREAEHYDFPYNGHPYWSSPEFRIGNIEFEGRRYYDLPINIDAYSQRLLLKLSNAVFTLALTPGAVTAADIDGRHYVGVGPDVEGIEEGFYDVTGNGSEMIYKQIYKPLLSTTGDVNGEEIGYYDPNYRRQVTLYFAHKVRYFFRDVEGHFSPIRNRSSLIRKFPTRKKEIRRAVQAAGVDVPGTDFGTFCEVVLKAAAQ